MAIDDLLDEHEQSERVLAWLRQNGAGLIGGIALGLAAIGGWKWWQHEQVQRSHERADRYQAVVSAIDADPAQAAAGVEELGDGVLGDLAAMKLAAAQVQAGDTAAAIATLRDIEPQDAALDGIVRHRLARLLVDDGQAQQALELLASDDSAAALEVRGDAQLVLGQRDQARESYTAALAVLDVGSPHRGILELKLTEAGGVPASTEAQS